MRTRSLLIAAAALLLGVVPLVAGCSGESDLTSTAPSITTTTVAPAPDATATPDGSTPDVSTDGTAPSADGSTPRSTFKPKPKQPFPSTTKAPGPKPTQKATTTVPGQPTTTAAPKSPFCQYITSLDLGQKGDWVTVFNTIHQAVKAGLPFAPPEVAQPMADLLAGLDALQPAVDSGEVQNGDDLTVWLLQQPAETRTRLQNATQELNAYSNKNC